MQCSKTSEAESTHRRLTDYLLQQVKKTVKKCAAGSFLKIKEKKMRKKDKAKTKERQSNHRAKAKTAKRAILEVTPRKAKVPRKASNKL